MQAREAFCQYIPGIPLEDAFPENRIPLLTMEHLRELNYMISRGISYEQTVDSFLLIFSVNESFRRLRKQKHMVILLNEEGALIKEDTDWRLIFSPKLSERKTLPKDADLYSVYQNMLEKAERGEMSSIMVPGRSLKTLIPGKFPFCILDEYCKNHPGGYLTIGSKIVTDGPAELFRHVPVCTYGELTTVDPSEIQNYRSIHHLMREYIKRYDSKSPQENPMPLSIAVFGAPGAGKSFGVKQIAKSLGRFTITSINLSQYGSAVDLFSSLKEALTCNAEHIPMVFFDEFDSELNGVSRGWLKYFLAPMQDGEFTSEGRLFTIPGAVFVFAGATATSFQEFLPHTPEEEQKFAAIKGPDFVSRLKGILDIKGPNPSMPSDRRHIIRRALLLRNMLKKQAPNIYDAETGHIEISRGLLNTLLLVSEYRHGSRSIEFILGMSRLSGVSCFNPSCLPLPEQLDIHLDVKDFMTKLTFEQVMGRMVEQYAILAHESYRKSHILEVCGPHPTEEQLAEIYQEPEMADWEDLKEFYKIGHRNRLRYLGQKLLEYEGNIGLRPIIPDATDTIMELYGPVLEYLARLEHERWMLDKARDGWTYGQKDYDLKLNPEMVPYDELPEITKEAIRTDIRNMPSVLKEMGFEFYRKNY